jgi:hypothetical protein
MLIGCAPVCWNTIGSPDPPVASRLMKAPARCAKREVVAHP